MESYINTWKDVTFEKDKKYKRCLRKEERKSKSKKSVLQVNVSSGMRYVKMI
jgi:hypothetical protein